MLIGLKAFVNRCLQLPFKNVQRGRCTNVLWKSVPGYCDVFHNLYLIAFGSNNQKRNHGRKVEILELM